MRVLVVDDEQLVRWFLERALKKWGHEVTSVSNTSDALNQISQHEYDVLFTDLRMPGGDGTVLVKQVRDNPDNKLHIVVCSAFITADMIKDFNKNGIFTLKKPFKLAELENTLKTCEESPID